MISLFTVHKQEHFFIIPWEFSYALHQALTIKEKKKLKALYIVLCINDGFI